MSSFPQPWNGTYEGLADDGSPVYSTMWIIIKDFNISADIPGVCEVGVDESQPGKGKDGYYIKGSYNIEGSINWTTGELEMHFTSWSYKGELENERRFEGKYSQATKTIEGITILLKGKTPYKWNMYAE